jgi:hypothetical protein
MREELYVSMKSDRPAEQVFEISREFMHDLAKIPEIHVHPVQGSSVPGERGLPAEALGEFLLTFVGGSAGVALVECMRAYFSRDRALVFRLRRVDGVEITMEADRTKDLDSAALLGELERFLHQGDANRSS